MKIFALSIVVLLPIFSQSQLGNEVDDEPTICGQNLHSDVADSESTYVGEHPWIALIGYENENEIEEMFYACTGTLINDRYIVTTAVCVAEDHILNSNNRISHVRLGEHNIKEEIECFKTLENECSLNTTFIHVSIEETISHPLYDKNGFQSHNIALIRLEEPIKFSAYNGFIAPICLPPPGIESKFLIHNQNAEVAGWDFGSGHPNDVLMREFLPMADDRDCEVWFTGFTNEGQICMKSESIRKRCTGDSGSPLTIINSRGTVLVGILSYGPLPCGFSASPSVFTSISYYRDWIDSNMSV